jgi:hypothetical protein
MAPSHRSLLASGIRDNHPRGNVGDFLKANIKPGSDLSVVSAYFTIYAFAALQHELTGIKSLRFLFGEPRFIRSLDPNKTAKKAFEIEDNTPALSGDRFFNPNSLRTILKALDKGENIYSWAILQNLFFATLNQEPDKRQFCDNTKYRKGYNPNRPMNYQARTA